MAFFREADWSVDSWSDDVEREDWAAASCDCREVLVFLSEAFFILVLRFVI